MHSIDSTIAPLDSVPNAWLDGLAREQAFDYAATFRPETLWEKFLRWLSTVLGDSVEASAQWMDNVLWVVLGILLVGLFVIWLRKGQRLLGQRNLAVRGEATDVEGVPADDIDRVIGQEIAAQRWRSAIRYLYLRSLHDLQSAGSITWKKEKTNRDYLREVTSPRTHPMFAEAVRVFERTWYGDEAIDEAAFQQARPVFDTLHHSLRASA